MNPIDEYIQKQDEAVQPRLNAIRDTIRAAIPEATEKISYGDWQHMRKCPIR